MERLHLLAILVCISTTTGIAHANPGEDDRVHHLSLWNMSYMNFLNQEEQSDEDETTSLERYSMFRIGTFVPMSAKEEKLDAIIMGGLSFVYGEFRGANNKTRMEFSLDYGTSEEDGIEDKLFMGRLGGISIHSSTSEGKPRKDYHYTTYGGGIIIERLDGEIGPVEIEIDAEAFVIYGGVGWQADKKFDLRADLLAFLGSDNTTLALYINLGFMF